MQLRGRHTLALALCVGTVLTSSACYSTDTKTLRSAPPREVCPQSRILEPQCGVLWGVATQTPSIASLAEVESQLGRRFDMVYRFHQIGDALPTDDERRIVASGRILHVSLDSGGLAPAGAPRTWGAIADGTYDEALRRAAEGVASLQKPVFVTFDHEANQPAKAALGTAAQFAAAWRHVHDVFDQTGVTNAVWVWVMMGSPDTLAGVGAFWPGNSYVDWISWDVYNQSGCLAGGIETARYESFLDGVSPFYRWVRSRGAAVGIDPDKPMMISEAGSVVYANDAQLTAQWYAEIPGVLASHPQIQAIGLWDHTGNRLCDYRFEDDAAVVAAITEAGLDPRISSENG
jgi:Glycosyl hydrolase family 26